MYLSLKFKLIIPIFFKGVKMMLTNNLSMNAKIQKPSNLKKELLIDICNNSKTFVYKTEKINGYTFHIFSYLILDPNEFIKYAPYSFEMRGLTILDNGIVIPSIHKFFNHKENNLVMDLPAGNLEVREKIDGVLITPIVIDNNIIVKSKKTFFSKEASIATEFINNNMHYQKFILDMVNLYGLQPYFEMYSKNTRIVLDYGATQLFLIQMRNINDGSYIDYNTLKKFAQKYNIPVVNIYNMSISEIENRLKTDTNIEGWVVQPEYVEHYTDFRKFKTQWYLNMSYIKEVSTKENYIIGAILDEKIDDMLSVLEELDKDRKIYIEQLMHKLSVHIRMHIDYISNQVSLLSEEINKNPNVLKDIALKYKDSYEYFPVLMKCIRNNITNKEEIYNLLKDTIKKKTNKYTDAVKFVETLK